VFQPGDERAQVAVVDADEPGATVEYARQVLGIVQFDHGLHAEGARLLQQAWQFRSC